MTLFSLTGIGLANNISVTTTVEVPGIDKACQSNSKDVEKEADRKLNSIVDIECKTTGKCSDKTEVVGCNGQGHRAKRSTPVTLMHQIIIDFQDVHLFMNETFDEAQGTSITILFNLYE